MTSARHAEGMTDITTTIDNYIAAWNERDDARRWAIVRAIAAGVDFATVAADGRLADVTGFLEPVG
jgi:hypothetical protein